MQHGGVRLVGAEDERRDAVTIVGQSMLAPLTPENIEFFVGWTESQRIHAAYDDRSGRMIGTVSWFDTHLATPGGSLSAGAVTGVAVLPTHRRRGHLRSMMQAQIDDIIDHGHAVAILVAAEWPIYGHYGYGPAAEACAWDVDSRVPMTGAPSGELELVERASIREIAPAIHDAMGATWPGVITRSDKVWDLIAGLETWPGQDRKPGKERTAVWRDDAGEIRGFVCYEVEEKWEQNRPRGTATASELFAVDATAERELWRHLLSIDWVSTVKAGNRPLDDPIQLWMADGRAAVQRDRFDHVWVRILDVPRALGARVAGASGRVVIEVVEPGGPAAGRWLLEADAGKPIAVAPSSEPAGVRLPVGSLGAAYLGGVSPARLALAGWLDEEASGAVGQLGGLLSWPIAPWCPTEF